MIPSLNCHSMCSAKINFESSSTRNNAAIMFGAEAMKKL